MASIIEKALREIELLEKATANISPNVKYSSLNNGVKKSDVKVQVDTSDESNLDESNIFSAFNQASEVSSLRVDVKIDEDIEDDSGDPSIAEGGEETVMGQGTNPKPEDETYLNLLKKTTPKAKVKIKVDK